MRRSRRPIACSLVRREPLTRGSHRLAANHERLTVKDAALCEVW